MRRRQACQILYVCCALALIACEDGGAESAADADIVDATVGPPRAAPRWADPTVIASEAGLSPRLVSGSDGVFAAWYAADGHNDGVCTFEAEVPATRWAIGFGRLDGESWATEEVAAPFMLGQPTQLDLAIDPAGAPVIAAQTGEPLEMQRYCGAHDVGLFTRTASGGWTLEILVTSSNQAAVDEPASDFGEVVGHWPALAFGPDGAPAVVYKDIHGGGLQGDDRVRADLEFTHAGAFSAIDAGGGAGDLNRIAFDADGRPVVAWFNTVANSGDDRRGIWVARQDAGAWLAVRLAAESTRGLDVAIDPATDEIVIAWYSGERGRPTLARLPAGADFGDPDAWHRMTMGDPRFDEGYDLDLEFAPQGHLTLAWYRCARVGAGLGDCDPDDDAVVFAWFVDDEWTYEVIEAGGDGACGMQPTLTYDAQGRARVAWRCSRPRDETFRFRLETSRRQALR